MPEFLDQLPFDALLLAGWAGGLLIALLPMLFLPRDNRGPWGKGLLVALFPAGWYLVGVGGPVLLSSWPDAPPWGYPVLVGSAAGLVYCFAGFAGIWTSRILDLGDEALLIAAEQRRVEADRERDRAARAPSYDGEQAPPTPPTAGGADERSAAEGAGGPPPPRAAATPMAGAGPASAQPAQAAGASAAPEPAAPAQGPATQSEPSPGSTPSPLDRVRKPAGVVAASSPTGNGDPRALFETLRTAPDFQREAAAQAVSATWAHTRDAEARAALVDLVLDEARAVSARAEAFVALKAVQGEPLSGDAAIAVRQDFPRGVDWDWVSSLD
jgi:hypothetical protein